jgi:hypothetical protein
MKIKELFTDETKWTRGAEARCRCGAEVRPCSPNATSWCLRAAANMCYPSANENGLVTARICSQIGGEPIMSWNDAPERIFEDVMALVEELDI